MNWLTHEDIVENICSGKHKDSLEVLLLSNAECDDSLMKAEDRGGSPEYDVGTFINEYVFCLLFKIKSDSLLFYPLTNFLV